LTAAGKKSYAHDVKNIYPFALLVSILFIFPLPVLQGESYDLSLSPLGGFLYGQGEEIVYKYPDSDQYLSELLWDLKPLWYAGLGVDFGPKNPFERHGFIARARLKFGLPLKAGFLEDRDWAASHAHYLTNYSRHDTYVLNAILGDLSAGYSWHIGAFSIAAYGEFSYMRFSWSGEDGYVQFPKDSSGNYRDDLPWNDGLSKDYQHGMVIRYSQNWFILSPGFSLAWKISRFFVLEGNFNYSPLVYCADRDDHLLADFITLDYPVFGHYINGGGRFIFSPVKNLDLVFHVSWRYITGSRGDLYESKYGGPYICYAGGAGTGYSSLDIGLAAKIRIYGRE
jgi:outer membrane protease